MNKKPAKKQMDPMFDKIPPQSIEAEASLLSAVLIDNTVFNEIIEILRPSDFYRTAHQKIFDGMIELFEKSEPVDLVTLSNFLKDKEQLEEVGGSVYLAKLIDEVPLAVNAAHYAKIIHDKATLRGLIERGYAIIKRCWAEQSQVDDVVDFAESCVFEVSESKVRSSFQRVKDLVVSSFDVIESRRKNEGMPTGVPTGFFKLDGLTAGFQKSDLIILAARPSMGKTAFALNIARNAAVECRIPVGFFSLEMSKEQLVMRLLCSEARIDSIRLRDGSVSGQDMDRLKNAKDTLCDAPIYIDDTYDNSVLSIRAKSRRLKSKNGLGLVIIDYLQLIKVTRHTERRDLDVSEISRSLKGLAKELEIPVVALSQLNRQSERRDDKRPRLSDLRESGALEQDADLVAFIHRKNAFKQKEEKNFDDGTAELIIAKHRNGPTDSIYFTFLDAYARFENLAPDEMIDNSY
jgi:replicative DNA helicase